MKRESLIDRVYRYCDSHFKEGRKVVVDHFLKENHPRAFTDTFQCGEKANQNFVLLVPVEKLK